MSTAKLILSLDFEIGWGDVTNPLWRKRESVGVYEELRTALPILLNAMDELDFPATWATVGAMFENPKERDFSHLPTQWKDHINAQLLDAKPQSFDGRDLFEMVLNARASHRIASHSYSHVPFTYDGMTEKVVGDDLTNFQRALSGFGLTTDRFVFPENREAHYGALDKAGYTLARVSAANRFNNPIMHRITAPFIAPPMGFDIEGPYGVIRQHGSMVFNIGHNEKRLPLVVRRANAGLAAAIKGGSTFHIWGHPFNYAASSRLREELINFMQKATAHRERGELEITVM